MRIVGYSLNHRDNVMRSLIYAVLATLYITIAMPIFSWAEQQPLSGVDLGKSGISGSSGQGQPWVSCRLVP